MRFTSSITPLHFYLLEMFGQCGFPFARLQYTWTDVSWLAGETTEALVCPHKLRASEPILTIVTTEMYNCTSPGWCRTCSHFVSSRHCGLKVLTDGRDALQVWHTLTVRLAHFASGVRLPLSPPSLARATTPQFGSVDHIFCLATSPTSKPGLSCICQCSGYRFLTDN